MKCRQVAKQTKRMLLHTTKASLLMTRSLNQPVIDRDMNRVNMWVRWTTGMAFTFHTSHRVQ